MLSGFTEGFTVISFVFRSCLSNSLGRLFSAGLLAISIMGENRRDSDLSSELYFSVYGNNRKLKPQKIKAYALYKPLLENTTTANNFVVAANETNEIFISFKEGSESKVFTFDKVFYEDISQDDFYLLNKSAIQDVIMGLNSFLILSKLASPVSFEINSSFKMDLPQTIIANVLKELLLFVNKEENKDYSLHVSYFEIHGNKLLDLLSESDGYRDVQMYENSEKDCVEIKRLIERPLINSKDINEIFSKKPLSSECNATCCHSVAFISLIRRNINNDGLEFIKVGKLTLVGSAEFKNCLGNVNSSSDDCLLKISENGEFPISCNSKILNILKPAFGEKVTTTTMVLLSSVLHMLEKDLRMLQFASEIRNCMTHPEIDLQLIIRNSTKEYAEEIKELQKCLDATSKGSGVRVDHLLYRSFKNVLALENEKVKNLDGQVLGLTDAINLKKQQLISLQAALESKESEAKEVEKSSEILKLELKEMNNDNNIIQKVSLKADKIIEMKQMIISNELYIKKLKLQLIKDSRNYEELVRSIHFLKNETTSLLCEIDAQNTSQKSTLELLIVDMNNTSSEFQQLEKDLSANLNNLLDIDILVETWKNYMENLISKFSSFIHEKHEQYISMELDKSTILASHNGSKDVIVDTIKNIWSEKGSILKYYFSKLQVFCDSSFKMLAEIIHQMDVIESCYKAEFKAISAAFDSTKEAFKKFVCDVNVALKSFQQYFTEEKKDLSQMANVICFHQKFKKQFDEKIDAIKQSLLGLKQMYLGYNDTSSSKWNEIQKNCQKTMQKHNDLSDHLSLFQREMSKYLDNLPQQKRNTLECSPIKDKTDNVENRILQLLQIHNEMKGNFGEAFAIHKKGIDEEILEIEKYLILRKTETEKHFGALSVKLRATTSSFKDELRSIYENSANIKEKFKNDLDSLSVSYFEPVFNNYLSTSNSILAKSERFFKVIPFVSEDKKDNIPDFENLFLEEWDVTTSTPNVCEKKEFSISKEKEKLICRMKSLAEQQISQKPNISILEHEEKANKNVSTVSLPNLRTHSRASFMTEKSFPRLRFCKK